MAHVELILFHIFDGIGEVQRQQLIILLQQVRSILRPEQKAAFIQPLEDELQLLKSGVSAAHHIGVDEALESVNVLVELVAGRHHHL